MFKHKNILITGSTRNTGNGIAKVFSGYGANVFVHGRSLDQAKQSAEELNTQLGGSQRACVGVAADIVCEDDVSEMFKKIEQQAGGVDVLVNNACHLGIGYSFLDMPASFFDDVLAVNLRGYALVAQSAARQMIARGGGAIVNIGSNTAKRALSGRAAYIASKGGVESLTRAMAVELAEHRIRVNCVVPGYINTERWSEIDDPTRQRRHQNVPLGRESTPEDIGEAAAFLASPKAANITGSALVVSGGIDAQLVPPDCAV